MVQADDPIYRITTEPTDSLADLLQRIRQNGGRPVFLTIPTESPLFLTASEFRALRETVRSNGINLTLISDDPHRREFALLFNLDTASEPPTHWPVSAPVVMNSPGPLAADPMEQSRPPQSTGVRVASDDPMASPPPSATTGSWGKHAIPDSAVGWPTQPIPAVTPEPAPSTALATIPETSVESKEKKKRKKWPWLTLISLLVAAGLVAAVLGPRATITLHRQATPLTTNVVFAVTPPGDQAASGAAFSVPGAWQQANVTAEVTVPATGQQTAPDKVASGPIEFANPTSQPVSLAAGTEISSDGGIVFLLNEAVTIPPATGLKSGNETGSVTAKSGGSNGNLGQGALSGKLPQGIYFSNRNGALAGGTDRQIVVVSNNDITTAISQLEAAIPAQTERLLTASAGKDVAVAPAAVEHAALSPSVSAPVGTEADQVTVTVATVVNALTYDPAATRPLIIETAAKAFTPAEGSELDPNSIQFGTPGAVDGDLTHSLVSIDVQENQVPIVDPSAVENLKSDVRGTSVNDAQAKANAIPGIESSKIVIEPSWLPDRLPILPRRIEVELK